MKQVIVVLQLVVLVMVACSSGGDSTIRSEVPTVPQMPGHWKITSDNQATEGQLKGMSDNLGVDLAGVRNTIFDVNGKRVQINVIVTSDTDGTEKLMTKLKSMKSEEGLLRKGLIVYEFVGQNDVLPEIAEGRKHLDSL